MNTFDDDHSEDGELAQSPVQDEMDFSLSDEDHDNADSLVIKPPQAIVKPSHRDRRAHKKSTKDRFKDSRKEKKHVHRDREKQDKTKREPKMPERDDAYREKYYREREMYREKDFRDKESLREKEIKDRDLFRDKEVREKEIYRETYRDKEVRNKEIIREREITRETIRDREMYRDKEVYKEKEHHKEKEVYRDSGSYRDIQRQRDVYREKEPHREKEAMRDRETYLRYGAEHRKFRKDPERNESRLKLLAAEGHPTHPNEKENRDKTSGDKELEDLRSRLLSKRIGKELQSQTDKHAALDKTQQERRNKLLEAEREMEKRKQEARNELEARREERRRRGKKRSSNTDAVPKKKNKPSPGLEEHVVMVSDASDTEMNSDNTASEPEEGEHSKSESEASTSSETESNDGDTKSEGDDEEDDEVSDVEINDQSENEKEKEEEEQRNDEKVRQKSKSPSNSGHDSGHSHASRRSKRSLTRSKSRSRSRSHSFSPPPPNENGRTPAESETPLETDEDNKRREDEMNALPSYFPALQGCRSVEEFQCLNRIEEGTYGVVYRARDKTTEEIVALKRLKMEKEKEGFPITSLREINTLLKGQHPNIVTCREIVVGSNMDKIFIVMDYVEHDLKSLMETMRNKKQVFLPGEVKCLMLQLLRAVHHLHDNWILHRDLKTSNLLLSHRGILKVGDFGLAREYGSPLRPYTPVVVTLWYRAPELLLCCKEYSTPIDMWSVGCIFAELVTMNALFPGKSEVDQLNRIFKDLGTPSESIWTGYKQLPAVQKMTFAEHPAGGLRQRIGSDLLSDMGHSLLNAFLTYDPERRITADAAMEHAYFKEQPVAIDPSMFPTWPAKSEGGRRAAHSPRPPAGGAAYALNANDSDDSLGFRVHAARSINVAPGFSLKF